MPRIIAVATALGGLYPLRRPVPPLPRPFAWNAFTNGVDVEFPIPSRRMFASAATAFAPGPLDGLVFDAPQPGGVLPTRSDAARGEGFPVVWIRDMGPNP